MLISTEPTAASATWLVSALTPMFGADAAAGVAKARTLTSPSERIEVSSVDISVTADAIAETAFTARTTSVCERAEAAPTLATDIRPTDRASKSTADAAVTCDVQVLRSAPEPCTSAATDLPRTPVCPCSPSWPVPAIVARSADNATSCIAATAAITPDCTCTPDAENDN